jgi:hypothetical protein
MSATATLFLALLAVDVPLAIVAWRRRKGRLQTAASALVFLVPLLVGLGFRAARAFSTHDVLDWDESYYLSIAVTAANGDGLYPYIFGYGPMRIMGGIGYAAYSYALAVKLLGPTIFALRTVSLLLSLVGVAGIWVLVNRWYGSAAAWIASALTASLALFALANSVRMDSWTFAYVAWALVAFATAFQRWGDWRWHLAAGLIFGLGLQVHIDTVATALACGVPYLVRYLDDARQSRRAWLPGHPMFFYVAGFAAGVIVYLCVNVLPDPASYYATAVVVRLDATDTYAGGRPGILATFLNPSVLLVKEAARYRRLFAMTPPLEVAVAAAGIAAMAIRRNASDRIVLPLVAGIIVAAAIVLNNGSPHYYIHVLPALIVPAAAVFTHHLGGRTPIAVSELRPAAMLTAMAILCALCAMNGARTMRSMGAVAAETPADVELVRHARALVDRRCEIAGDGALYVRHFPEYPYFVSDRDTEVRLAMLFYGTTDETAYWNIKKPEVVVSPGPLRPGLAQYVASQGLRAIEPGLWISSGGCRRRR